jgi:hypothetical protein
MELINKALSSQNICGIEIDASATILPIGNIALQPFADTYVSNSNAVPVYFGRGSVSIAQQGKSTRSGMLYEQSLTITFPNGDLFTAERIQQYTKVKYIYIKLSGGMTYFFGRNDYYQNTPIKIDIKSTHKMAKVTYVTTSIFPLGLTNGGAAFLLPEDFPINFITL